MRILTGLLLGATLLVAAEEKPKAPKKAPDKAVDDWEKNNAHDDGGPSKTKVVKAKPAVEKAKPAADKQKAPDKQKTPDKQ